MLRVARLRCALPVRARGVWSRPMQPVDSEVLLQQQRQIESENPLHQRLQLSSSSVAQVEERPVEALRAAGWATYNVKEGYHLFTVSYQFDTVLEAISFFREVDRIAESQYAKDRIHVSFSGAMLLARITCFSTGDISKDVNFPLKIQHLVTVRGLHARPQGATFQFPDRRAHHSDGPYQPPPEGGITVPLPKKRTLDFLLPEDFPDHLGPLYRSGWLLKRTPVRIGRTSPRMEKLFVFSDHRHVCSFWDDACKLMVKHQGFGTISMMLDTRSVLVRPHCYKGRLEIRTLTLACELDNACSRMGPQAYRVSSISGLLPESHPMTLGELALLNREARITSYKSDVQPARGIAGPIQSNNWDLRIHKPQGFSNLPFSPLIPQLEAGTRDLDRTTLPWPLDKDEQDAGVHSIVTAYSTRGQHQHRRNNFFHAVVALAEQYNISSSVRIVSSPHKAEIGISILRKANRPLVEDVYFAMLIEKMRIEERLPRGSDFQPPMEHMRAHPSIPPPPGHGEDLPSTLPEGAGRITPSQFDAFVKPLYKYGWSVSSTPTLQRIFSLTSRTLSVQFWKHITKLCGEENAAASITIDLGSSVVMVVVGDEEKRTLNVEDARLAVRLEQEFVGQDEKWYLAAQVDSESDKEKRPVSLDEIRDMGYSVRLGLSVEEPTSATIFAPEREWKAPSPASVSTTLLRLYLSNRGWKINDTDDGPGPSLEYTTQTLSPSYWVMFLHEIFAISNQSISAITHTKHNRNLSYASLTIGVLPIPSSVRRATSVHIQMQRHKLAPRASDPRSAMMEAKLKAIEPAAVHTAPSSRQYVAPDPPPLYPGSPIPALSLRDREDGRSWVTNEWGLNTLSALYKRGWGVNRVSRARPRTRVGEAFLTTELCKEFPFVLLKDAKAFFIRATQTPALDVVNRIVLKPGKPASVQVFVGTGETFINKASLHFAIGLEQHFRAENADHSRLGADWGNRIFPDTFEGIMGNDLQTTTSAVPLILGAPSIYFGEPGDAPPHVDRPPTLLTKEPIHRVGTFKDLVFDETIIERMSEEQLRRQLKIYRVFLCDTDVPLLHDITTKEDALKEIKLAILRYQALQRGDII